MKNKALYFFSIILFIIIFLSGPRLDTRYTIKPVEIPADAQQYIQNSESRFSDIRPGTDKKIIWNNILSQDPTEYSIVYLHGFSASRQELVPVCDQLAKSLSANLFYTRLTGHGRTSDAMNEITANALLNDAVEALEIGKRIGKKVILIGTSTGGTLATWLATQQNNEKIAALVLLSPNYGLKRPESELLFYPWGLQVFHFIQGKEYQFSAVNPLQEKYWTTRYPSDALLGMFALIDIVRESAVSDIKIPTLVLYSENDNVASVDKIKSQFSKLTTPTRKMVSVAGSQDPQHHILAGNVLSPDTTGKVLAIIQEFLSPVLGQDSSLAH